MEYVNCGKSALVMKARRDDQIAALKIFDPDLVQRFGRVVQLSRIARETTLIGKNHPNLVGIYDGGECPSTGHLFVAMEYIDAPNLGSTLETLPRDGIRSVLSQVAAAAEYLESMELVHRDIKPENIVVTAGWARTVLLDLGVLRPLAGSDLTDETNSKPFIGTLRYAAPEYLLRENEDSAESWRALTFYQLGAVLHDLIMRRPLFSDYSEPYGRLVQAVLHAVPAVDAPDVDPELLSLAKDCLVKSAEHRLRFVSWNRFQFRSNGISAVSEARQKLAQRRALLSSQSPQARNDHERTAFRADLLNQMAATVRQLCVANPDVPPVEIQGSTTEESATCLVTFPAAASFGLHQPVKVSLVLHVVDYGDSSILIAVGAHTGDATNCRTDARLFEGVLEWGRVRAAVDGVICHVVVRAQELFEVGSRDIVIDLAAVLGGQFV